MKPPENAAFEAPGPGQWQLDRSHFPGGTTLIMREIVVEAVEGAYRVQFAEFGIPAETLQMAFVHGFPYTRVRPLIAADRPSSSPPPEVVTRLVTRLHPAFRRRTKAAAATLEGRAWSDAIEQWHQVIRPRLVAQNRAFAAVDVDTVDDDALADHVSALITYLRDTYREHFRLHGHDLGPIGFLVTSCAPWGIDAGDVLAALVGASPSTTEPARHLRAIRDACESIGVELRSLDDVRTADPEAAQLLDAYLARHGAVLCSGYDIDTPTLGELPDLVLATIRNARPDRSDEQRVEQAQVTEALRGRVPVAEQIRFDRLLADARAAMDLRDDNGPITVEWPSGLLRLALLASGRRHARLCRLDRNDHVLELRLDEIDSFVRSGNGPSALELATRASHRHAQKALDPPRTLGPAEVAPSTGVLPAPLAELMAVLTSVMDELGMAGERPDARHRVDGPVVLTGTGIGSGTVVARARTAASADLAFDLLEPGDILVTRTTTPAYNMVLTLVGGLVTAEGGPMSHAAVLSRELAIPAVIGVGDAIDSIADGTLLEIDAVAGTATVVGPPGTVPQPG